MSSSGYADEYFVVVSITTFSIHFLFRIFPGLGRLRQHPAGDGPTGFASTID
jgi:hypothetical protein